MAKVDLVAPSRAGDKFHYYWAARKALELLRPGSNRTEIVVEGRAPSDRRTDADEVIDVAEYFTPEAPKQLVFSQLKHSSRRLESEWTLSDFADVIPRFAAICADLIKNSSVPVSAMSFRIVTNRPIAASVEEARRGFLAGTAESRSIKTLRQYVGVLGENADAFLECLEFDDAEVGAVEQVDLLTRESGGFLVASSSDLMLRLKEVVADRASSKVHAPIRRADVLVALRVDETELLPAPNTLESVPLIDRAAYMQLRDRILQSPGPYVVHAAGGVGKSSFSSWLMTQGHRGHEVLVFDSFAGGSYREISQLRHDHRRGLTQLANELATRNLCAPLVPTDADDTQYMRAFLVRVREAARHLSIRNKHLIIVIDAADSAVLAAEAQIGSRAFAPDLLREVMPDNVRIVLTARTERVELLRPPPHAINLQLATLDVGESRQMLSRKFHSVTAAQASEFCDVTWGNARVQDFAIRTAESISAALRSLATAGMSSASEALDELIRSTLFQIRDRYGARGVEIDKVCAVLASLRPVIRLSTVAEIAEVPASLVESFLVELPFSVQRVGDTLHFRDEPTETYFREHLKPSPEELQTIVSRVERLATGSFYLASALPQLLWESGRHDNLIELALADRALPATTSAEAREVAKNRTEFALRAAIELRRWGSASRIALHAARLTGASSTRDRVVAENCDLAGFALDLEMADRYVASRALGRGHPGFNLAREGLLLAKRTGFEGTALGRLRSAGEWMTSYSRQLSESTQQPGLEIEDVADLLLARLLLQGAAGLEDELDRFREWVHFPAIKIVARRFLDQGNLAVLNQFISRTRHRFAALACCEEIWECDGALGASAARAVAGILKRSRAPFKIDDHEEPHASLRAALAAVVLVLEERDLSTEVALRVLYRHLPTQPPSFLGDNRARDRSAYVLAMALVSALNGTSLESDSLASDAVRSSAKSGAAPNAEVREFRTNVTPSLPWLNAWAQAVMGKPIRSDELRENLKRNLVGHDAPRLHARWVLRVQTSLNARNRLAASSTARWIDTNIELLGDTQLIRAVRALRFQSTTRRSLAERLVRSVEARARSQVSGAAATAATYIELSRACWPLGSAAARDYFLEALDSADLIGDEVDLQWRTTLDIAHVASSGPPTRTQAIAIARASEAIQRAQLIDLDPGEALRAIGSFDLVAALDTASRWRDRRRFTLSRSLGGLLDRRSGPLRAFSDIAFAIAALHDYPIGEMLGDTPADRGEDALTHAKSVLNRRGIAPETDPAVCALAASLGHSLTYRPESIDQAQGGSFLKQSRKEQKERRRRKAGALEALQRLDYAVVPGWQRAFELGTYEHDLDVFAALRAGLPVEASADRSPAIRSLVDSVDNRWTAKAAMEVLDSLKDVTVPERRARHETVERIVARYAHDVVTSSFDVLPLPAAARMLNLPEDDVRERAFRLWARSDERTTVEGYYAMTVHLAELAGGQATLTLLDDAIEQFADVVAATSEDLPPLELPTAANTIEAAIARMIWGALADPSTAIRWDAAYATFGLLSVGREELLIELCSLAASDEHGDVAEPAVEFYSMHADWFLLLALRRAVVEQRLLDRVALFEPFVEKVLSGPAHAILTPLSIEVRAALDDEVPQAWPQLEPVTAEWSHRGRNHYDRPDVDYHFGWDFRESEIHGIADALGIDRDALEEEASDVITKLWSRSQRGDRDEDARHNLGFFAEGETYDRYANPPAHDLDHYLSFHSLMIVTARNAAIYPAKRYEGDDEDELSRQLRPHKLARPDGYWVGETRVGPPTVRLQENGDDRLWRWGIGAHDFLPHLHLTEAEFVCWADSNVSGYSRAESVRIQSVLVPTALASAYCRSLQIDRDLWDFRVPVVREHDDQDDYFPEVRKPPGVANPFTLQPWIRLIDGREGLDKHDRAAHGLTYPPPLLETNLSLTEQDNQPPRTSWVDLNRTVVAWAEAWNDQGYRETGRSGSRLVMKYSHLDAILRARYVSIVAVVSIDRRLRGGIHRRSSEEEFDRVGHYFRVFEYRPGRGWLDYRGSSQPG